MFTISKQRPSKYFDIEAERTPEGQNLRSRQNEDPKTRLDNLAKEYRGLVDKGSATNGQKEWLKSYANNPLAPQQIHYFHELKGNGEMLTKGQEAFLKSYGSDPRVPEGVHYIRQSIAEDLKITDSQKELLETYEGSKKPKLPPSEPNINYM